MGSISSKLESVTPYHSDARLRVETSFSIVTMSATVQLAVSYIPASVAIDVTFLDVRR